MPGRKYSADGSYRYGFNGKENDNDVKGEGNQQDYGMRIYDPRLGRFLSVDPISNQYPELTPYQFAGNSPILAVDLDGLEPDQNLDPTKQHSLSNSELLEAVKIARSQAQKAVINKVKDGDYYSEAVKQELDRAISKHTKQADLRHGLDFSQTVHAWYSMYYNIYTTKPSILAATDGSLTNPEITDSWKVALQRYEIKLYENWRLKILGTGAVFASILMSYVPVKSVGLGNRNSITLSEFKVVAKNGPAKWSSLSETGLIDPKKVRFSQENMGSKFKDGRTVNDMITGLRNGSITAKSVPAIRIVEKDGLIFTLDNRRLYAFQQAGVPIRYQKLDAIPKGELGKFSTKNQGVSIEIRK